MVVAEVVAEVVVVVVVVKGLGWEGSLIYVLNGRDSLCPSAQNNQPDGRVAVRIVKMTSLSWTACSTVLTRDRARRPRGNHSSPYQAHHGRVPFGRASEWLSPVNEACPLGLWPPAV